MKPMKLSVRCSDWQPAKAAQTTLAIGRARRTGRMEGRAKAPLAMMGGF
jgi:hypothetical protein